MPTTSWTGSITFGMVTIPVRLLPAVRKKRTAFNQLDKATNSRIRYRKVAEATGEEVAPEQIVKAVQLSKGDYVVVTDEELEPIAPVASRQIDLETFVPAADLDPIMFDASYYVLPDKLVKPYALLTQAMAGTGRAGIGRFVMRQRGYLAAIRSDGERLVLSTLVYPDELVDPASIDDFRTVSSIEISERELTMARTLVDALSEDFDHSLYVDEYRTALETLIENKASGRVPSAERIVASAASVVDLMEALQASVEGAKAARGRHPTGRSKQAGQSTSATTKKPRKTA